MKRDERASTGALKPVALTIHISDDKLEVRIRGAKGRDEDDVFTALVEANVRDLLDCSSAELTADELGWAQLIVRKPGPELEKLRERLASDDALEQFVDAGLKQVQVKFEVDHDKLERKITEKRAADAVKAGVKKPPNQRIIFDEVSRWNWEALSH